MENKDTKNIPKFSDARSKKVIFMAHCILNQNARIDTCAYAPAAIPKIPEYLIQHEIGMIQWPCPEFNFLGLGRQGQDCNIIDGTYKHEDGEVYDQLSVPDGRVYLKKVAQNIVFQIKEYRKYGFQVLGILGIIGSPSCGVNITYYKGVTSGNGALIEEIINALEAEGLNIPIKGISELNVEESLAAVKDMISS